MNESGPLPDPPETHAAREAPPQLPKPPVLDHPAEPRSEEARRLYQQGLFLLQQGNTQQDLDKLWRGMQTLIQVTQLEPHFPGAIVKLAEFYWRMHDQGLELRELPRGKTKEIMKTLALSQARNALDHAPQDPDAKRTAAIIFHNIGTEESEKGDHNSAFDYYECALAADPQNGKFSFTLLQVEAESSNQQQRFTVICEKYINEYPELYRDKTFNLGMVFLALAEQTQSKSDLESQKKTEQLFQRAKECLLEYQTRHSDLAESHYGLGELHAAMGNFASADDELRLLQGKDAEKAGKLSRYIAAKRDGLSAPHDPPPPLAPVPPVMPRQTLASPQSSAESANGSDKKVLVGVCAIALGAFGVHKFLLGYIKPGLILLGITVLTCGYGAYVTVLFGVIEGIIYLTKSDDDFVRTYIDNKKQWF
jgi:tetratricopeptide (TPR) repeat protein